MRVPLAAGLLVLVLAAVLSGGAGAAARAATTYYVSPTGNDAAAGTSAATAWRTVAKVDATTLGPGDQVLFQGGGSFTGLLQPKGSGASGAPITFASYGTGSPNLTGGIQLASQSWLVFDGLTVDTGDWQTSGTTRGIRTLETGTGVTNVTVRDCTFANVALGLIFSNHRDTAWTVTGSTIEDTRDSGILIYDPTQPNEIGAGGLTFVGNRILSTGLDPAITYPKHGVYDVGIDSVWRDNVITGFHDGGFSLRARGNTLVGNTISGGPFGIFFSPYDSTPGTTRIAYNEISNVTGAAIEADASGKVADVESFVITDNSLQTSGSAPGVRVVGTTGAVTVANNLVETATGPLLRIDRAGAGVVERNNLWWSTAAAPSWGYLGNAYSTLAAYRAGSGQGAGDLYGDPVVSNASAMPPFCRAKAHRSSTRARPPSPARPTSATARATRSTTAARPRTSARSRPCRPSRHRAGPRLRASRPRRSLSAGPRAPTRG